MSRVSAACVSLLALPGLAVSGLGVFGLAGAAQAQVADRYGPTAPAYDGPGAQAGPPIALAGAPVRMLSWPGKVTPPAVAMAQDDPAPALRPAVEAVRAAPAPRSRPMQVASAAVAPPRQAYAAARYTPAEAPAPSASRPRYGLVQAVPRQPIEDAPSIYDPPAAPKPAARATPVRAAAPLPTRAAQAQAVPAAPPPRASSQAAAGQPPASQSAAAAPADAAHPGWAPPRHAWSQAGDNNVRFYSLHRQYGVAPDPAPIPPQFFAATADLGEPAGPMTRTISGAGSTAQAARAVQAAQTETSSDPAASQP